MSSPLRVAVLPLLALLGACAAESGPACNDYLAAGIYATTPFDSAQSDAFPYPVEKGTFYANLQKAPRLSRGPVNVVTLASTSPRFMWAVSSEGVAYVDVSGGGFREVARAAAPGAKLISPDTQQKVLSQRFRDVQQVQQAVSDGYGLDGTRLGNGACAIVDRDNHCFYDTCCGLVCVFALADPEHPEAGIRLLESRDFRPVLGAQAAIAALSLSYDGRLAVLGTRTLSIIDRSLEGEPLTVRFGDDEAITGSLAMDEANGIYVASGTCLRKLVWTGSRLSQDAADGAWSVPCDHGRGPPAVKLGSGSTPALMGFGRDADRLVVVADGAERTQLVAFWRDAIPAGWKPPPGAGCDRVAGQIPLDGTRSAPDFVPCEPSVVVHGYGAFVVNTIGATGDGDRLVDVLALGPVNPPATGCQRVEWDPQAHRWRSVWSRKDVVSTSMAPSVSTTSGIVFVNGYSKRDGWELTGLDWNTGQTVHRTIFGHDNLGNGACASIQFLPDGDLLFNSVGGPARVHLRI